MIQSTAEAMKISFILKISMMLIALAGVLYAIRALNTGDVADKISQVQTHDVGPYQNVPTKPVVILSAKVLP